MTRQEKFDYLIINHAISPTEDITDWTDKDIDNAIEFFEKQKELILE